ncbi:MAG: tape measure protein, partial [Cyanobacteria bacterium J06636_28]
IAATELAEGAIEAAEDALGIASPSKVFIRIGEQIAKGLAVGIDKGKSALGPTLGSLKDGAVEGFKNVVLGPESERQAPQFQPFQVTGRRPEQDIPVIGEAFSFMLDSMESMKNAATFIPKLGRSLAEVFEGLMQNTGMLMGMAKGALVFNFAIKPLIGLMVNFENQSFAVAVGLDNMARMITFVSGSAREGARNIDFIREKVLALGGDINASMSGFGQLAASSQGTRMEGEGTRQLFGAISQASSVYQLDAQTQDRAFTATAQMLDKTVVSAEELRGQLAEALPGSLAIAARAMGMTTQEMGQMMSTGQIMAEDLLPKFAQQLSAETASGVAGSANSAQSAINQLNNEVLFLQEAVGKTSIPVRVTGIKAAATGMRLLRENMELIAPVMTAVFITLMKNAVINAIRFLAQFAPLTALFKAITAQGAKMFATLLAGMRTFAAQFARTFIIIQGITDLLAIFQKALGDTSGGIKDLAEISTRGWEDYAESV